MAHHLPDNALSILSCPRCGGLPLQYHRDGALLCSVCCAVYPQRNGIFDLRPPDHDQSREYQGDPPEAARLRNRWDSTRLQHKPGVQAAIEEVARRTFPGCRVLDVGCGTGHIDRWIIERAAPGTRLWAFDVSEAMCRFAQQNCERFGQVTVIRAASRSPMPFRGGSFDVVFERLATIDVALAYEFLRPGGWFIQSGLGDANWQEVDEVFADRCIVFPKDQREPKELLIQSGFVEAEFHSWRYTDHLTLDEVVSILRFAPIVHHFDQRADASLLEILRQRWGTPEGIALTVDQTLLMGKRAS